MTWPKDSCNFQSFRSWWGGWPRYFFQYTTTGPRHPGYFDSWCKDGIRPFPQRPNRKGPQTSDTSPVSTSCIQTETHGFYQLPVSNSWRSVTWPLLQTSSPKVDHTDLHCYNSSSIFLQPSNLSSDFPISHEPTSPQISRGRGLMFLGSRIYRHMRR
jgi:hypothetical protein